MFNRSGNDIFVTRAAAIRPMVDGVLDDSLLAKEKRSPKIGILPLKARMVLAAAAQCLPPSLLAAEAPSTTVGISLGTAYGSMDVAELCRHTVQGDGFKHVVPSWYATGLPNATAAIIAALYKLGGPNLTFLGYQAGIDAIIHGCRQIASARVSTMLAGGFDMPSAAIGARLANAYQDHPAGRVEPGVGLLCLSSAATDGSTLARIVGWAQQGRRIGIAPGTRIEAVVAQAMAHAQLRTTPHVVHVIDRHYLERAGDQLAASAPIYLVEQVLDLQGGGLHAVVTEGLGQSDTCLLLEKT
jgi:3-oxoacyl-[acyl-carrier-protein] synthase II